MNLLAIFYSKNHWSLPLALPSWIDPLPPPEKKM